jgi:hypothetical protein
MVINMKLMFGLCLLFCSHAFAEDTYPKDVAKFIDQRDLCDHFRGEYPLPQEGKKEMLAWGKTTSKACYKTDEKRARLIRKYQNNSKIIERLNEYEVLFPPKLKNCDKTPIPQATSSELIQKFPTNVQTFIIKRDTCNIFMRKIPSAKASSQLSDDWIKKSDAVCSQSTDQMLSDLKAQYSDDSIILHKLNQYPLLNPVLKATCN